MQANFLSQVVVFFFFLQPMLDLKVVTLSGLQPKFWIHFGVCRAQCASRSSYPSLLSHDEQTFFISLPKYVRG